MLLFHIQILLQTEGKLLWESADCQICKKIQGGKSVYLETSRRLLWNLKFLKDEKMISIAEAILFFFLVLNPIFFICKL
jgi:hypothetical protein